MLRIIIAILEALFGIESEAEAPPTRRQARRPARPAGSGGAGSAGADGEKPVTVEDIFKRLLGIEDEPPPAKPAPRQPQPAAVRAQPAERPQQQRPAMPPPVRQQPKPRPTLIAAPPAEKAAAPSAAGSPARSFARRLRGNTAAAREAFVYAEIFGTPMADRRPGEGRP